MHNQEEKITLVDSIESLPAAYFNPHTIWIYDKNIPKTSIRGIQKHAHYWIPISAGESLKSLETVGRISEKILSLRMSRPLRLIVVGGGACGDAIGFIASILWRGVDLIHVPTTLLAMIDSSIGGKTAVNLGDMKNQLGTFYRGSEIILDSRIISTLPVSLKREGKAEMLKSAWLDSEESVNEISKLKACSTTREWAAGIQRVADFKKRVVSLDPYDDKDIRIQLNFGHSVAHGIERLLHLPHGEAVAWGLLAAARIGPKFGMSITDSNALFDQASEIIRPHGGIKKLDLRAFEKALLRDKKRKNGKLRSVIVTRAGTFEIRDDVSANDWFKALQESYAILDGPRRLKLGKPNTVLILPPLSKSEQIRLLSFPSSENTVTIDNDDTFYAEKIFKNDCEIIQVGEGATGFRFAAIQAAFTGKKRCFEVADSLAKRQHSELWTLLKQNEIEYRWEKNQLHVIGKSVDSISLSLGRQTTSHIASGLALLSAHHIDIDLQWEEIASYPYFEMTLSLLEQCGATIERREKGVHISPLEIKIEPNIDLDAGAYALWSILQRLNIPIEILGNVDEQRQPDFRINTLLDQIDESSSCMINLNASPDLGPVLGSYAAVTKKNLTVTGAEHLRNKESNRIEDFLMMLKALDVDCDATSDGFIIRGELSKVKPARIDCKGDHRLVMAAAVLSTAVELTLSDPMSVSKSYWNFWQDLRHAGFLDSTEKI